MDEVGSNVSRGAESFIKLSCFYTSIKHNVATEDIIDMEPKFVQVLGRFRTDGVEMV